MKTESTEGKFLVDINVPRYILPNGTKAYIETIYHEILFPYNGIETYIILLIGGLYIDL